MPTRVPLKRIFVTGAAGFIGMHTSLKLKERGDFVIGLDNFNAYYDPALKKERRARLNEKDVDVIEADICDTEALKTILQKYEITHIVHLAAQAGVRHSLLAPEDYVTSNLQGFTSVLEACRLFPKTIFVYASSSSVYGLNRKIPFSVDDKTDAPANFYGATKKANEVIAHAYHHLYGLRVTGLRYFTAYGPWGRPDMAYFRFTEQILEKKPISLFGAGLMKRDFTYIDDIVAGTISAVDLGADHEIFNLGHHRPIEIRYFLELLEKALGEKAIVKCLPVQMGEVMETYADIEKSQEKLGYMPRVPIEEGVVRFTDWYKSSVQRAALR